ncbi:metal-dependent hydrolase [Bacillus kexueae]|uniref:metal-dependent hydrolase n=1 Tax=Aeribacillus kexueae TaxID=2078952 RepID=UPI001FAFB118|nr:metal-dependent hydrolase [Bacillus kexueae]
MAQVVILGTVVGSNAPDFDYVIRIFKGKGMYVEHHRGVSHSIPALFLWTIFISVILFGFFPAVSLFHLIVWVFIAVVMHVALDVLNAYGTKALIPFTNKWIPLNFIPLFDPFFFLLHLGGLLLWIAGVHPQPVFCLFMPFQFYTLFFVTPSIYW